MIYYWLVLWFYLSIKLHSFVHYSPSDVIQFVCNPVDIPRTIMHTECCLMVIFTLFNFLKPILFLNIVFFIQLFFCKLIQWKQKRLLHVSCVFANKIEHGKTTIT